MANRNETPEDKSIKEALKEALPDIRQRLQVEMSPMEFRQMYADLLEPFGHHATTSHGTNFIQEGWLAMHFAERCDANSVWISPKDPPDFYIRKSSQVFSFEVTQVTMGRRAMDEVKEVHKTGIAHVVEDYLPTVEDALSAILKEIDRKNDDRYKMVTGLIVYLNCMVKRKTTVYDTFEEITLRLRAMDFSAVIFKEIWLVYSTHCDWIKCQNDSDKLS